MNLRSGPLRGRGEACLAPTFLKDSFHIAFREAWLHPLRTGLALLGMIIGASSIIGFDMLGRGTQFKIISNMENLSNSRLVEVELVQKSKVIVSTRDYFDQSDEKFFREQVKGIEGSSLQSLDWIEEMSRGRKRLFGHVYGIEPEYNKIYSLSLDSGRFIIELDDENMNLVCVLGSKIYNELYTGENPIGTELNVGSYRFNVVGLLKESPIRTVNDGIFVPYSVVQSRFEASRATTTIALLVKDISLLPEVRERLEHLMRTSFGNRFPNYRINTQDIAVARVLNSAQLLRISLFGLAGVLMLVGGIGIMNVEMASVLERSKEIGIRKAYGARDEDIFVQLLLEAGMLGLVSGFVGIVIGVGLGKALLWIVGLITHFDLVAPVSISTLALAWFFATALGMIFGLAPSLRGSRLDIIEIIRTE